MTPQERDTIIGIIADVQALIPPHQYDIASARNRLMEMESFVRTMAQAHVRETAVWITRDDVAIRIVDLDDDHLLAIERAIAAGTAPATETDRTNITRERERRGLTALKARKPMEARISKILTETHAIYRRANADTRRHFLRGFSKFLKEASVFMNASDRDEVRHAADVVGSVNPGDAQLTVAEATHKGNLADLIVAIDPAKNPDGTVAVTVDKKTGKVTSFGPASSWTNALAQAQHDASPALRCGAQDPNSDCVCVLEQGHAGSHTGWPAGPHVEWSTLDAKPSSAASLQPSQPVPSPVADVIDGLAVSPTTIAAVAALSDRRAEIREMLKRGEITQDEAHAEFPETF